MRGSRFGRIQTQSRGRSAGVAAPATNLRVVAVSTSGPTKRTSPECKRLHRTHAEPKGRARAARAPSTRARTSSRRSAATGSFRDRASRRPALRPVTPAITAPSLSSMTHLAQVRSYVMSPAGGPEAVKRRAASVRARTSAQTVVPARRKGWPRSRVVSPSRNTSGRHARIAPGSISLRSGALRGRPQRIPVAEQIAGRRLSLHVDSVPCRAAMTARFCPEAGQNRPAMARHRQTGAGGVRRWAQARAPADARVIVNRSLRLAIGCDANRVGAEPDDEPRNTRIPGSNQKTSRGRDRQKPQTRSGQRTGRAKALPVAFCACPDRAAGSRPIFLE